MGAKKRTRRPAFVLPGPDKPGQIEAMRIWIEAGRPCVSLAPVEWMDHPSRWGALLADVLLHIVNAYRLAGDDDSGVTKYEVFQGLCERLQEDVPIQGSVTMT